MLAILACRSFARQAAPQNRLGTAAGRESIRCVDDGQANRASIIGTSCGMRHYSSTPPSLSLSRRRRLAKKTKRYNQQLSRRNEAFEQIVPRGDRIDALRQKIKDISEGREPQQNGEAGETRPNYAFDDEEPNPKARRKDKRSRSKVKPEPFPEDAVFLDEEPKPRRKKRRQPKQATAKAKGKALRAPYSVFVSCLPGLEPLLMEEVQYLERQWGKVPLSTRAKKKTRSIPGGVKLLVPSVGHIYTLHLYLGTASHIYLRLNDFKVEGLPPCFTARGFPELKRKLADLIVSQKWDSWLDTPHRIIHESNLPWQLQVHVTTSKSKLMHTKAVEERVRETIGEVLGIEGLTTSKEKDSIGAKRSRGERPIVRLLVRIERDVVQVSLDTSASSAATPLHMRGYRLNPFKAPLREDLAFALLMAGGLKLGWNLQPPLQPLLSSDVAESGGQSTTAKETSLQLFDPFCGSGTIAIEGCSLLAGLPPGRFRPPPLLGTNLCDASLWGNMKSNAMSNAEQSKVLVAANDINKGAIDAAISNASRAGVRGLIHFSTGSFKVHPLLKPQKHQPADVHQDTLHVISNPPYGKRLSTPDESRPSTYKELAKALISSPHKLRCTLIGNNPRPLRESALPLEVAFSTKQGGLNVVAFSGSVDSNRN